MGSSFAEFLGILGTVALATTIVAHRNSANVIKAGGSLISGSLSSAEGASIPVGA